MVAALSPWPSKTATVALAAATARLKAAVDPSLTDERVQALGSAASAMVEAYAPGAPQALRDIAVERCSGWMHEQPAASRRSGSVGDIATAYAPSLIGMMLYSGSKSLLYSWRRKTAGTAK